MAVYQFYFFKEPKQLKPPLRMQLKLMYIYTAGSGAARQQSEMWPKSGCGKQLQIMPEMENCCLDSTYSCLYYPQCPNCLLQFLSGTPPPSHLLSSCSLINDDDHRTTTSDSGYPDKKFPFEIIRSVHDARSHSAQCHKTLRYSANFFSQFRRGHEFNSFLKPTR